MWIFHRDAWEAAIEDHNHSFHVPMLYKLHKGLMTKRRLQHSGNPIEHSGV